VLHINRSRFLVSTALVLGLVAVSPRGANAQYYRGHVVRPVYAGPVFYPRYPYYSAWLNFGYPWAPYPYPYFFPYPYYAPYAYGFGIPDVLTSSVRLDVTPRTAAVYVDGYAAGKVDDYDGIFQRLRLRPGNHEIVLFLAGYRTIRQSLYLNPGSDQKISYKMEQLGQGEAAEPPPPPSERPPQQTPPPDPQYPFEPRDPEVPPPSAPRESSTRFGTLAIRVQPADAEILIDGERWSAPADQDRITVQLAEGRHRVEIRKAGFAQYSEEVLIRRNNTLALNVSLLRGGADGQ